MPGAAFKFLKERNGFTLIELLVVIAIIGILSSVIFLSTRQARDNAYFAKAKKELRSFHEAIELYLNDSGGDYPPDADRDIPPGLEQYLSSGILPDAA